MDRPSKPSPSQHSQPPTGRPQSPSVLHHNDADEVDDSIKQLHECSSHYLALQDCMVNTNRNWKSCQKEVQALKACNQRRRKC